MQVMLILTFNKAVNKQQVTQLGTSSMPVQPGGGTMNANFKVRLPPGAPCLSGLRTLQTCFSMPAVVPDCFGVCEHGVELL
jgi:hypothetical protein